MHPLNSTTCTLRDPKLESEEISLFLAEPGFHTRLLRACFAIGVEYNAHFIVDYFTTSPCLFRPNLPAPLPRFSFFSPRFNFSSPVLPFPGGFVSVSSGKPTLVHDRIFFFSKNTARAATTRSHHGHVPPLCGGYVEMMSFTGKSSFKNSYFSWAKTTS